MERCLDGLYSQCVAVKAVCTLLLLFFEPWNERREIADAALKFSICLYLLSYYDNLDKMFSVVCPVILLFLKLMKLLPETREEITQRQLNGFHMAVLYS